MTSQIYILPEAFMLTGIAPIFNAKYEEIGTISYRLFSLQEKMELKNKSGEVVSVGKGKTISFSPQRSILTKEGKKQGTLCCKRKWWKKEYQYTEKDGTTYHIKGNIAKRNFRLLDQKGDLILRVTHELKSLALRPYTFAIEILQEKLDPWEMINLVQGVRALFVKEEKYYDDYKKQS